jgi:hypothetical protein
MIASCTARENEIISERDIRNVSYEEVIYNHNKPIATLLYGIVIAYTLLTFALYWFNGHVSLELMPGLLYVIAAVVYRSCSYIETRPSRVKVFSIIIGLGVLCYLMGFAIGVIVMSIFLIGFMYVYIFCNNGDNLKDYPGMNSDQLFREYGIIYK